MALAQRDHAALREHAALCARQFAAARTSSVSAKYERLVRDAESAGLPLVEVAQPPAQDAAVHAADPARTVYSRMLTCISPNEHAQRGLQLVLEATGADTGYLFGLRSGKLEALASSEPADAPAALHAMLDDIVRRAYGGDAGATGAARGAQAVLLGPLETFIDELSREFEPILLSGHHRGEAMIAGVAALHYNDDERPAPRAAMLDAVVDALVADAVVDPVTCVT